MSYFRELKIHFIQCLSILLKLIIEIFQKALIFVEVFLAGLMVSFLDVELKAVVFDAQGLQIVLKLVSLLLNAAGIVLELLELLARLLQGFRLQLIGCFVANFCHHLLNALHFLVFLPNQHI